MSARLSFGKCGRRSAIGRRLQPFDKSSKARPPCRFRIDLTSRRQPQRKRHELAFDDLALVLLERERYPTSRPHVAQIQAVEHIESALNVEPKQGRHKATCNSYIVRIVCDCHTLIEEVTIGRPLPI